MPFSFKGEKKRWKPWRLPLEKHDQSRSVRRAGCKSQPVEANRAGTNSQPLKEMKCHGSLPCGMNSGCTASLAQAKLGPKPAAMAPGETLWTNWKVCDASHVQQETIQQLQQLAWHTAIESFIMSEKHDVFLVGGATDCEGQHVGATQAWE